MVGPNAFVLEGSILGGDVVVGAGSVIGSTASPAYVDDEGAVEVIEFT